MGSLLKVTQLLHCNHWRSYLSGGSNQGQRVLTAAAKRRTCTYVPLAGRKRLDAGCGMRTAHSTYTTALRTGQLCTTHYTTQFTFCSSVLLFSSPPVSQFDFSSLAFAFFSLFSSSSSLPFYLFRSAVLSQWVSVCRCTSYVLSRLQSCKQYEMCGAIVRAGRGVGHVIRQIKVPVIEKANQKNRGKNESILNDDPSLVASILAAHREKRNPLC